MRIGTWNLDARWRPAHEELLVRENCDVWLLTEVSPDTQLTGYHSHFSARCMTRGQHFAAIFATSPLQTLPDPHPASAAAVIGGVTFCSSILPWAGCGQYADSPWPSGTKLEELVRSTIDQLVSVLPMANTVWGGDWNQNLSGGWQYVGCSGGRARIEEAIVSWGLQVPTADLLHRRIESQTIDHIAVPSHWRCVRATRVGTAGLSDHDAYVIDVEVGDVGNA